MTLQQLAATVGQRFRLKFRTTEPGRPNAQLGFNIPNYSLISPIGNTNAQQGGTTMPTSTPKLDGGACLNVSDPTHNRGKANIVNSFINTQVLPQTQQKQSKGGKVKSSQGAQVGTQPQPSTSFAKSAFKNR